MQRIIQILIITFILTSCSENFDAIDPTEFNKKIENRTDIKTAKELIEIYYNYPENEGVPNLTFDSRKMKNGFEEITLIHEGLEDDSQRATKIVMLVEQSNKKWVVKEIKTNRKCWDGRGHTNWSTEWCS
jgi:PBP1b-binding outer membrane lipoprotein LpoB